MNNEKSKQRITAGNIKMRIEKNDKSFKMNATLPKEYSDSEFAKHFGMIAGQIMFDEKLKEKFDIIEVDINFV